MPPSCYGNACKTILLPTLAGCLWMKNDSHKPVSATLTIGGRTLSIPLDAAATGKTRYQVTLSDNKSWNRMLHELGNAARFQLTTNITNDNIVHPKIVGRMTSSWTKVMLGSYCLEPGDDIEWYTAVYGAARPGEVPRPPPCTGDACNHVSPIVIDSCVWLQNFSKKSVSATATVGGRTLTIPLDGATRIEGRGPGTTRYQVAYPDRATGTWYSAFRAEILSGSRCVRRRRDITRYSANYGAAKPATPQPAPSTPSASPSPTSQSSASPSSEPQLPEPKPSPGRHSGKPAPRQVEPAQREPPTTQRWQTVLHIGGRTYVCVNVTQPNGRYRLGDGCPPPLAGETGQTIIKPDGSFWTRSDSGRVDYGTIKVIDPNKFIAYTPGGPIVWTRVPEQQASCPGGACAPGQPTTHAERQHRAKPPATTTELPQGAPRAHGKEDTKSDTTPAKADVFDVVFDHAKKTASAWDMSQPIALHHESGLPVVEVKSLLGPKSGHWVIVSRLGKAAAEGVKTRLAAVGIVVMLRPHPGATAAPVHNIAPCSGNACDALLAQFYRLADCVVTNGSADHGMSLEIHLANGRKGTVLLAPEETRRLRGPVFDPSCPVPGLANYDVASFRATLPNPAERAALHKREVLEKQAAAKEAAKEKEKEKAAARWPPPCDGNACGEVSLKLVEGFAWLENASTKPVTASVNIRGNVFDVALERADPADLAEREAALKRAARQELERQSRDIGREIDRWGCPSLLARFQRIAARRLGAYASLPDEIRQHLDLCRRLVKKKKAVDTTPPPNNRHYYKEHDPKTGITHMLFRAEVAPPAGLPRYLYPHDIAYYTATYGAGQRIACRADLASGIRAGEGHDGKPEQPPAGTSAATGPEAFDVVLVRVEKHVATRSGFSPEAVLAMETGLGYPDRQFLVEPGPKCRVIGARMSKATAEGMKSRLAAAGLIATLKALPGIAAEPWRNAAPCSGDACGVLLAQAYRIDQCALTNDSDRGIAVEIHEQRGGHYGGTITVPVPPRATQVLAGPGFAHCGEADVSVAQIVTALRASYVDAAKSTALSARWQRYVKWMIGFPPPTDAEQCASFAQQAEDALRATALRGTRGSLAQPGFERIHARRRLAQINRSCRSGQYRAAYENGNELFEDRVRQLNLLSNKTPVQKSLAETGKLSLPVSTRDCRSLQGIVADKVAHEDINLQTGCGLAQGGAACASVFSEDHGIPERIGKLCQAGDFAGALRLGNRVIAQTNSGKGKGGAR